MTEKVLHNEQLSRPYSQYVRDDGNRVRVPDRFNYDPITGSPLIIDTPSTLSIGRRDLTQEEIEKNTKNSLALKGGRIFGHTQMISQGKNKNGKKNMKKVPVDHIPSIPVSFKQTIRRRFQANVTVGNYLTIQGMLNQFLYAVNPLLANPFIGAIRLKALEGWSNQSPTSPLVEGYVQFSNGGYNDSTSNNFNSPPWEVSDTTNSQAYTAHVKKKFQVNDPTGSWHAASNVNITQNLVLIACSASSTIDMTFQVIIPFGYISAPSYTPAISGATAGCLYARVPLTGLNPVGVNVI